MTQAQSEDTGQQDDILPVYERQEVDDLRKQLDENRPMTISELDGTPEMRDGAAPYRNGKAMGKQMISSNFGLPSYLIRGELWNGEWIKCKKQCCRLNIKEERVMGVGNEKENIRDFDCGIDCICKYGLRR